MPANKRPTTTVRIQCGKRRKYERPLTDTHTAIWALETSQVKECKRIVDITIPEVYALQRK